MLIDRNYYITAAQYSHDRPRVDKVWLFRLGDTTFEYDGDMTRDQIVTYLKSGYRFIVVTVKERKALINGIVLLVSVEGEEYLRLDGSPTPADDLGPLPAAWRHSSLL